MYHFEESITDQFQRRGDVPLGAKKHLEKSFAVLAQSLQPTPTDRTVRQDAVDRLNKELIQIFPAPSDVCFLPFGSFRSSCFGRDSDLDLAVTGRVDARLVNMRPGPDGKTAELTGLSKEHCATVLRLLADRLQELGMTQGSVTRVLGDQFYVPRVPVIKFKEATTGISCDVSVNVNFSDFKSAFMALLHRHQPLLTPLVQLVKTWAKHHRINSAPDHTFNSWTLELLTVWCCQTYPLHHACDPMLIPPLWKVVTDQAPGLQTGGGRRPLQGWALTREKLEETLRRAEQWLEERAAGNRAFEAVLGKPAYPSLLELFRWFLHCGEMLTKHWLSRPMSGSMKPCVSTWQANLCSCLDRFDWSYRAAVEDPFDYRDNTARTLGKSRGSYLEDHDPLPQITRAFSSSMESLMTAHSTADAERALAGLFGDVALDLRQGNGSTGVTTAIDKAEVEEINISEPQKQPAARPCAAAVARRSPSAASLTGASGGGSTSSASSEELSSRGSAAMDGATTDDVESERGSDVADDLSYWLRKFTLTRKSKMLARKARAGVRA